ncbi:MAG TPA: DNA/RNA non-specific endonuclease [Mucilaginibacter sp.]|nr:DNA/RNA non-specific endonuclease [Mucilaginibacter sp.]
MTFRRLLLFAGIIISIAGCKKDNDMPGMPNNGGDGDTTVTTPPTPYVITETFESGSKQAYADANVTLSTGEWDFNNALIGNLSGDAKNGNWSVRMKTGDIAMNFDINGVTQISISHAKYGSDAASTWQLKMSTDGGVTYTQIGNDIMENNTTLVTDSFKVTATTKVRFEIVNTGSTRINIDDITFKGTGDPGITVNDGGDDGGDGGNTGTASGTRGVTVGSDAPPTSGDNSDMLFGNPSDATATVAMMDNYLIDQGYYIESYNSTKGEPNWVSWHLDASNTTQAASRQDNFAGFNGLPSGWYTVQSNSYSGSGFDRGHNCPSADRTSSVDANSSTFLMTNMIPQAPQNNQQTWNNLEGYLRSQVSAGNEVYIIMGSYGTGGTGSKGSANTINDGHVNVPSNVWKVAVILPVGNNDISRVSTSTRVIAVDTPNDNSINSDWTKYIVTVHDIEQATGYNLLSALPQNIQDAVEGKKDPGI